MAEIPIPFTDEDVSTDNPVGMLMTLGLLIVGFVLFAFARSVGQTGASTLSDYVAQVIGVNPATGESGDSGVAGV